MENKSIVQTPSWINDLIVYEIATKGFTSPNGPESGTFNSLKEKIEYLKELGITGIWLTGNQLSDYEHFYGIWTQYACIRPDELDPSLGTREDFKALIDEAHRCGIKVFLDVIGHGVMKYSSLVKEKPHWFKGESWGMSDYDWFGNHTDLDEWWVNTWVNYVKEFHIDGFRLDVAVFRHDLWSLIRKKAFELGHEIAVFMEFFPAATGVTDFPQDDCRLTKEGRLVRDVARFMGDSTARRNIQNLYKVKIIYEDGTKSESHTGELEALDVSYEGEYKELKQFGDYGYVEQRGILRIDKVSTGKKISEVIIYDGARGVWANTCKGDTYLKVEGEAPTIWLHFPLRKQDGQCLSIQLSSHDYGWEGFPADENPYNAQGSRFLFGYGLLFAPAIPIFMSGEEFNADFVPLPRLSPKLYGECESGKGTWLYGSWIQWDQLKITEKCEMLHDVKKMIHIRKQKSSLIHPLRMGESATELISVKYESDSAIPVPYMYCSNDQLLIIAGNPNESYDVKIALKITAHENLQAWKSFKVTDLWNDRVISIMTIEEFESTQWTITKDKTAGGGLLALTLESIE